MALPNFLQNIKGRVFATGVTTASTIGLSGYLATVPATHLESFVGAFVSSVMIATAPQFLSVIIGIATNLISEDLYSTLTQKELYAQIPKDAN